MKEFFARKDVWFNILTGICATGLMYAEFLEKWQIMSLVIAQVVLRETFGAIGMAKNQNGSGT